MEQKSSSPGNIVLHQAENAWTPSCKGNHPIGEKEKLKRCVQGTLNKLTFQKFKILLSQIQQLKFKRNEDLGLLIDLIFDNAINEPHFCVLYANLCKDLCENKLSIVKRTGEKLYFHDNLLSKCTREFEVWCIEQNLVTNTASTGINHAKKKHSQMLVDEEMRKTKRKQIGIVRFIGELFNFHLIRNVCMHNSISRLLSAQDNVSLELVCEFFKTAGKELDDNNLDAIENHSNENLVNAYFVQMQTLVDKSLTSTRMRFMLLDVIDLRKNCWIPRRAEEIPKTIDEIHMEIVLQNDRSD